MKRPPSLTRRSAPRLCCLLLLLGAPRLVAGEPTPAASLAFDTYSRGVEARLVQQHRSRGAFLAAESLAATTSASGSAEARLQQGDLIVERLTPVIRTELSGALLHHWRGTAFAPGATAADLQQLLRDVNAYPRTFSPEVLQARVLAGQGDRIQARMRVRQRHVIPVVLDTTYNITFGQLDGQHGYSVSQSTRIAEIASPGTKAEYTLSAEDEHGFLWRLNTYWSYEQRDGGLYLQIEAVSLTRSVPRGLDWMIRPYLESIPRDSIEFTLRAACNALRNHRESLIATSRKEKQ